MIRLNGMLALAACALMATAACGDDETGSGGSGGAGAAGGASTTASTAANGGSGGGLDCPAICSQAYTCLEESSAECPEVTTSSPQQVEDDYTTGCLDTCGGALGGLFAGIVSMNASDCDAMVSSMKAAQPAPKTLTTLCEGGGTGGGGGAGGGAAGGAGGN